VITPPDYELAEKQARLENAEKLRANLNAPEVFQQLCKEKINAMETA
jgi:hypothetical protein